MKKANEKHMGIFLDVKEFQEFKKTCRECDTHMSQEIRKFIREFIKNNKSDDNRNHEQ